MHFYTQEKWDRLASTLDDARTTHELYKRLSNLGFISYQELTYRGGSGRLYVRQTLPNKKLPAIPFDFCCVLHISDFAYTIAVKGLEDMLQFLKDIDAHPKDIQEISIANISELGMSLSNLADRLEEPTVTLTNFSDLKTSLTQLTRMLGIIIKNGIPLQLAQAQPESVLIHPANGDVSHMQNETLPN